MMRKKKNAENKLKAMQRVWKIAHCKSKQVTLPKNVICGQDAITPIKNENEIENLSQKNQTAAMIKAINKLADKYPANVANTNQKIWRFWE